jgi:hypothetical protein
MATFAPSPVPARPLPPALASWVALVSLLPGCGGFDRGPDGVWDNLSSSPTATEPGGNPMDEGGAVAAPDPGIFDPAMVEDLPDPARRFLLRAIAPGTPLAHAVELRMAGSILLDPERGPMPMEAVQILAPPRGFIWSARAGSGLMQLRGFDRFSGADGEMRWRLFGLVTVMHATGGDVTRSAAARLAMEGVMLPSALVPRPGYTAVRWEAVDDRHARFVMTVGPETVLTTLEVDGEGRPLRAWADRWNEGKYERFQVELSGEFTEGGYRLPGRVEAGWRVGDPDEFRFFEARLTSARFHP